MAGLIASIADWIQTWAQPISGLGTLILTVFLVVLYRQQQKLLEDSYNADHRAVVEVEKYTVNGDQLTLSLSNVGNGVATDLELVTATVFEETDTIEPGAVTNRLALQEDFTVRQGRRSIKAHEDRTTFVARPSLALTYSNGHTDRVGIRTGMEEFDRAGVELVRIHWYLRYQDLRGSYTTRYIDGIEVDVDTDIEQIEQLDEKGEQMAFGDPEIDSETLELDLSDAATGDQRTMV